jgi:hypothetical protein
MMHRSRAELAVVALVTAVALVAVGCASGSNSSASTKATATTKSDPMAPKPVTVDLKPSAAASATIGAISVHVKRHGVAGAGRLTGRAAASAPVPPEGMNFASAPVELKVIGTTLTRPVTVGATVGSRAVRIDRGAKVAGALLAFYNETTQAWTPVGAQGKDGSAIRVTSDHLSIWTTLKLGAANVASAARSLLTGFLGVAAVADPTCDGSDIAPALGIKVTSDSGDLVKWCYGANDQGAPTLTVANNRHYAVGFEYPSNWTPHTVGDADAVFDHITLGVARIATPAPAGRKTLIVGGGRTVWFEIPAASTGQLSVSPNVPAYLASALLFGAETFAMTFGKVPGVATPNPSATAKAIDLVFASKSCVDEMSKVMATTVDDASSAGALFRSVVNLATGCLKDQWQVAYGITGFMRAFAVSVALWLVDGVKLVMQGVQAAIDSAVYWRTYRVVVDATAKVNPTLGRPWAPDTEGFGDVRPSRVFNGGDESGLFTDIVWDTWGGQQAIGNGTGWYVALSEDTAGGHYEPIRLVAYDLQVCGGRLMYRHLAAFFPQLGEKFDPSTNGEVDYDLCGSP